MNTRRYIRIIVVLLFLLTNGVAKMWAEVGTGDIKIMNTTGGNVTVNSVEAQSGDYKVTMTATPAGGYEILKKDFVVEPVTDPSLSRQRQAPGIAATLEVEDGTSANEFYFILPARYSGAIVTANFSTTAPIDINNLGDIKNPSGNYRFSSGFSASGTPADNIGSATNPFKGKIDGNFVEISLGNDPLFKTVDGAIIKNVIISSASTTTNGHSGAIANVAKGDTRIYNCGILGGTITGSGYVGGIVGFLDGNSRVINCYSYANIAASGTDKGGIVGYNNYASKHNDIRTMVMNCMFYGTIATGGNVSPVYGGENIDNLKVSDTELGLNTYNYYRYESNKKNITSGKYNCALAAKDKYLVHFELYRQLLNSNRKLAAWYAVNDASKGVGENNEMAKWVLDKSKAPYPILKKQGYYSSIINYDPIKYINESGTEVQRSTITERNKGKILGELTVNVSAGSHGSIKSGKEQIKLKRIDKDFDNYNYNYDKVQLPYYNEVGIGNYTGGMVVTGWKVTITSSGSNSYTSSGSDVTYNSEGKVTQTPYNFADRNCTGKDDYSTSTRVFSQGAYFDVPYGVNEISIEAYWGKAAYICDKYYDVVYTTEYNGGKDVIDMGMQGNNLLPGGQTIYTSITGNTGALASLTGITNPTVYDYALVLVGNLHLNSVPSNGDKPFTIMSADFDNDNEPDYSLIYTHPGRSNGAVSPIRFDFINVPGMAMAQKPNGATKFLNVSIFKPKGWFEVTNTCLITVTQFEYDNGGKASATTSAPVILLGGEYEQFVSTQSTNICADGYKDRTSYIHIGSNAWFKEFNNGTHSDGYYATKHIPVSVTGGYYEKFYLSGAYRPDAQVAEDDAEGYISGGKFDEVAGAGQQQIDGNVYWQIYDADITDFYGGGVNYDKPITGNITVDIFNSHVTTYCGGPKFGDMQKKGTITIKQAGDPSSREKNIDKDRTVTTNATGCVFGDYFGAGYGGISFVRRRTQDATAYDFSTWVSQYTNNKGKYFDGTTTRIGDTSKGEKAGPGVAVDFDYEFFVWSTGETGGRFYIKYASLSFAKTNDVNSTLNDCHITHNFYGGGHLGKVDGNVTSALNGCTIDGEVFGAGYSANRPTVPYRNGGFTVDGVPDIDTNAGVFADGEKVAITDDDYLTLEPGKTLTNNKNALGSGTMYTNYTEAQLNSLGTVAGKVTLTIDNYAINSTTTKETTITGNVYGGGESSDVYGVNSSSVVTSEVEINVKGGSMVDVYGGGKGQTTIVGGDVTVNIGKQEGTTYKGDATITGSVYGGSALGAVNAKKDDDWDKETNPDELLAIDGKETKVNILKGTVNGSVFGGGLGDLATLGTGHADIAAKVFGDVTVTVGVASSSAATTVPIIAGSVYGGSNVNGILEKAARLNVISGTIGTETTSGNNTVISGGNVHGGGFGQPTLVKGDVTVNVGVKTNATPAVFYGFATILGDVYGGSAKGNVNAYLDNNNKLQLTTGANTDVNLYGGEIRGSLYGGGLGALAVGTSGQDGYVAPIAANVYGPVVVTVEGGKAANVFGCNNYYGAPQQNTVAVYIKGSDAATTAKPNPIGNVYGGGNQAAYNGSPTITMTGGTVGNVFGGGLSADVTGSVVVNIQGGTVTSDVYGGGALANTNTANWDPSGGTDNKGAWANTTQKSALYTTTVNLTGGSIRNVYGGGLGNKTTPAYVWGNVRVDLNGTTTDNGDDTFGSNAIPSNSKGCIVDKVFGCNNINGTPKGKVLVHVHSTQSGNAEATKIANVAEGDKNKVKGRYDVTAVYGGGNEAAYDPIIEGTETETAHAHTHVVIEGCDLTSIETVYGGGNAASTPSTKVEMIGSFEVNEVFGGGNGKDPLSDNSENLGANVGYYTYENPDNATTEQKNAKRYGFGKAEVEIGGGIIHSVYGGSNKRGNVREVAIAMFERVSDNCFKVDEAYGGGKAAPMDGRAELKLGCIPGVGEVYGGARDADVNNDVVLTITNGTYNRIFGGNNEGHNIKGTITVNIEETGCTPIIIGQLFGAGNQAEYIAPLKSGSTTERENGPTLNLKSFTSIGEVYGGGFSAKVTGDTRININEIVGNKASEYAGEENKVVATYMDANNVEQEVKVTIPAHTAGEIGVVGNVYGGGYGADVSGNTYVNIGTESTVAYVSGNDHADKTVVGANITGDVFGGGYGASTNVTGTATVNIGEKVAATFSNNSNIYGGSALGSVATTAVNLYAGTIPGNVFGGGKGSADTKAKVTSANVTLYDAILQKSLYGGCNINGETGSAVVTLHRGTIGTAENNAHVFGGGFGHGTTTNTAKVYVGTAEGTTYTGTSIINGDVYGGSALGAVGTAEVHLNRATTLTGNVFGGGMGSGTSDDTKATITVSATVYQNNITMADGKNIYGGCNVNGTAATTTVKVIGGKVQDVFGGGFGQNTYVIGDVLVNIGEEGQAGNGAEILGNVYGGSAQGHVNGTAATGTLPITPTSGAKTTVNLNKGTIYGDAYGGGLGRKTGFDGATSDVSAYVGGDVFVNVNGAAFITSYEADDTGEQVVKSGRVFGSNNLSGMPLGDVTVTVTKTVRADGGAHQKGVNNMSNYEIAAVYGGGNLAPYTTSGKKAKVVVDGCSDVSIQHVYGGGNAAAVPATDVLINGAYDIYYVFGGGNGKDKYKNDNGWLTNNGADVNGNALTLLKGGEIQEAYGGSNEKGTISGSVSISMNAGGTCPLSVESFHGAGKNADIEGDLIVVLGCKDKPTKEVFGGAENAHVKGNVELTITSGEFGKVFGGNNLSGFIFGSIKLNIEESGCSPIIIDELYGCGNQAAYSIYGYKQTGTDDKGKPIYAVRTNANDGTAATFEGKPHTVPPYAQPELNIISATRIGKVFGGGLGTGAVVYGSPTVNINQTYPLQEDGTGTGTYNVKNEDIGTIGDVFGGGNEAAVVGNTTVNIGNRTTVDMTVLDLDASGQPKLDANGAFLTLTKTGFAVKGANIEGNVYGGGNEADVTGNTFVNICATGSGTSYTAVAEGSEKVKITGNVYGGGKGLADNFLCNKAMVGTNDAGLQAGYSDGNTSVIIGNGTVNGNVYGGGEIGRVEMNTTVTIGLPGEGTSSPDIKGDVFGGGKGDKEHGYAGLVRGNPTVTIQANAKVEHNVYGGGEIASVARYKVPRNEDDLATAHSEGYIDAVIGRPYALKDANSGFCTVTVRGNAVIGPDYAMEMTKAGGPDDAGHVFGAGKGIMPENYDYASNTVEHKPRCRANDDSWTWFADIDEYIAFIQTLALSSQTTVNIGDANDSNSKPFVKGSVYGGSENGLVQFDTNVNIIGGQIGCGKNANGQPHPDGIWADNYVPDGTDYECASWNYGKVEVNGDNRKTIYAPYDPFANAEGDLDKYPQVGTQAAKSTEGGRRIATDGHTYYGNVFGGGSGSVPYFDTTEGISKYLNSAGTVKGNTNVTISGGHILTSVYGGCEATNVLGTANVTMTGGTIGVPRKDEQILAHPVTCNLFGAGKGDQRVFFNKDTNVENAVIQINGGRIYGSVFGGGEDGHVMKNVTLTIEEKNNKTVKIGSAGTSYMDGNVFGGGRGFGGDALTAGNVGGTVTLNIKSGSVLGSVYGGGRLASVGYGLYLTTETGFGENHDDGYGKMQEDGYSDWTKGDNNEYTRTAISGFKRGYINVNISGGTIGNTVANAQYGGNVFGGSMGSIVKQDGTVNTQWDKFATAKKTTVNVTGGTIMRSVYGGGEMGTVTTDAIVNFSGGTIGDANHGGAEFGNVYGGGKGYVDPAGINYIEAGIIKGNTTVTVSETDATNNPTLIYHNIYGGGAYGSVGEFNYDATTGMPTGRKENTTGGIATITITGGTIGTNGDENGMVFGSSRGDVGAPNSIHDKLAWVYDTQVTINGGQIKGSVYGGAENGHNYHDAVVNIQNGTIGIASGVPIGTYTSGGASYPYRGNVYGGGCGTDKYYQDPAQETHDGNGQLYNPLAGIVRGNATITMTGGTVVHNIYGAGAMGSVGTMTKDNDDHLVISSGGKTTIEISGGTVGVSGTVGDGNVFGAARGDVGTAQTDVALVKTTGVTISQAEGKTTRIYGNVYGGGALGDVGTYYTITEAGENKGNNIYLGGDESGVCTVTVTGGTIGSEGNTTVGHVFGAGKGDATTYTCQKAMVKGTTVTVSNGTIYGNVYGGGEVGRVEHDAVVTIGTGTGSGPFAPIVHGSVFGAGAGLETHGYSALVRGNSTVTVQGNAKVRKNVYGGGETATVGKYWVSKFSPDPNEAPPAGFPDGMPYKTRDGGLCNVTIQGDATVGPDEVANVSNTAGHVFGAGKGVVPHYVAPGTGQSQRMNSDGNWESFATEDAYLQFIETLALASNTNVTIGGNAAVKGSVYGGSESGFVQDHTIVTINKGEIGTAGTYAYSNIGNIFGGGRGISGNPTAGRVGRYVSLTVNDGTAHGSVYGGGEMGVVKENVTVNILGGTIDKDVYGGGALAHTQTGNWDTTNNTLLADKITDGKTAYKTTVNLLGGLIKGDAYGGGLGDLAARGTGHSDVAAMVYGDVFVTLGNETEDATAATATAFRTTYVTDDKGAQVVNSGRVFGCNNLNGSPKGNVTVTVNRTVTGKDAAGNNLVRTVLTRDAKNKVTNAATPHVYEVAAVYGGGNLANCEPAAGKKPMVRLTTCDISIEEVYGGGNAAMVPETDVLILGAHEIEHVFGGGNGEDKYTLNGTDWITNPGANVGTSTNPGNTNTLINGGYVHEAYGASNSKGTIFGDVMIDTGTTDADHAACPVQVEKLVAAGKDADVNGNLIVILGCKDAIKIPLVYGGADNANVNGNVELTITSGHFGQVFGGNNLGGAIRGHIILNIEETSDCEPIRIDELYLGGNQASYSKFGYYIKTTTSEGENATGKGAPDETPELKNDKLVFMPRKSKDDPHYPVDTYNHETRVWTVITDKNNYPEYADPVMNLISCTEATEVFGGGFGEGGDMYANPTVNINMIPGKHADNIMHNGTANPHDLGTIGDVYGGGNQAAVVGNATINIGSANEVTVNSMTYDPTTKVYTSGTATVEGAYITGNVYGGGKLADVTGNTYVNVCAKEADDASTADVIEYKGVTISGTGYEGVTIAGNVFGGGKGIADSFTCAKAMIGVDKENDGKTDITKESTNKGTRVSIGNGTVNGSVYGGGEIGRVEWNTVVTIGLPVESGTSAPVIGGDVFGAGKGVEPYGYAALVRGNTFVNVQADAKVGHSIYGGGEIASVGKYTIASAEYAASHPEIEEGMPYSLANQGSGYCNVIVRGKAEIGPDGMVMNNTTTGKPDDLGHVFGAGKGVLPYENLATIECQEHPGQHHPGRMAPGNVWECYEGNEAKYLSFVETQALATQTDVTIDGNAFVKGSVYGGSENGHVQHDTHVTIAGGQIGAGEGINKRYTDHYGEWPTETESIENSWKECAHWEYTPNDAAPWDPYAIYESEGKYYYDAAHTQYAEGGAKVGKDGHTFYGNVFGGGSGLLPYAPGKWHRASGSVGGNTQVDITGGHILTSVYGGNEQTDVGTYKKDSKGALVVPVSGGKCTINMKGGTLGVPRTAADAKAHPVTCYLFGAGKGDQRIFFNTWTNVINTEVNISGTARIYGSTFGGGEDGHVIDNAETNISGTAIIGTTGTSYVDGNVFGGGRGFSGDAQTAGTVGGNVKVNISGGKMLGNIYGGGRLASVGTMFTAPDDPNYGNFVEDGTGENAKTYGHVTVNISGGIIGNTVGNAESGNVFGGSMGRLTLLDGTTINPIWPKMAQVKEAKVTISGDAVIKRNVYGGGELGTVRDNATVTINGGTVNRDVYGAGYGSKDYETKTKITVKEPDSSQPSGYKDQDYVFTPMIFAGCVGQNTYVNIAGGKVRKSVYGGGEMASVGIMDCRVKIDNNATDPVYTEGTDKYVYEHFHSHLDENNGFALSWPFHFENVPGYFGETHVNITGGRIGVANGDTDINTDNGDVYGGGKGIAGEYKNYVYCANVGSAEVTIDYPAGNTATPQNYMTNADIECIAGAVYGGAENGHVMGDTKLTLKNGLIGHSMYGGGSGKGTFSTTLLKIGSTSEHYTRDIYSFTAGKVFGNSTVEMSGGTVVRNVYGGGNMGSVGKGNYAGGADDYSTSGYGETLTGNLWDNANDYSKAFLGSGKCTVNITGGTIGYIDESDPSNSMYPWNSTASLPYGNVFGGCRGESAPNIVETPRYLYSPEFFVGYANETAVTIGKTDGSGPTILGSVYGGGMDGHIRRDASVTILGGEIGIPFTEANKTKVKTSDLNDIQWLARGNVYGSGSGIGKYKYDFDYDGKYESTVKYNNGRAVVDTKEEDYSTSAGSVTRFTTVDIKGGTIHRNVYGGGSLSSIGAPKIGQSYDPYHPGDSEHSSEVGKQSLNKVTISGGQIGDADCLTSGYGGDVNGGSRGAMAFENSLANPASFANSVYTEVTISDDADVKGNVFGGGEAGIVKHDTEVKMQGGTVGNDLYGGGELADVGGNTTVLLTGGIISNSAYGGARGTAEIAAKVGGDVLVDLNNVATSAKGCVVDKVFGANNVNGTPEGHVKVHVHATQNRNLATVSNKSEAENDYDVSGVFGGGNNADYVPTDTKQSTEVIIEGCDLTSIFEVYGGGYGAATPGTNVLVKGTKIIDNVFGGGYGAGANNPGANVGYRTDKTAYGLDINGSSKMAVVQLMAGHINNVYGGSNTKGDIRGGSSITNLTNTGETGTCSSLDVGKVYGGGKDAEMKGGAEIVLGCMPDDWIEEIYAGAENADVGSDVSLTITSGKFGRVFGGNKTSGRLHGSITVNIEENPDCDVPIIIGELYGGGNQAPYSIYGYKDQKDSNGKWIPREKSDYDAMSEAQKEAEGIRSGAHNNPQVNVRSFTSIGNIFGGGYGEHAVMVGSPTININEVILPKADGTSAENGYDPDKDNAKPALIDGTNVKLYPHEAGKMGVISTIFGGGNAAKVIGDTHVNIGTTAEEPFESLRQADGSVPKKSVAGADIRGNVYGGGNNAEVTGKTDVVIGQKKE